MPPKTLKLLEDIRDAAEFVMQVTRSQTESALEQDRLLRQAVERNFEIIGEALNQLTRVDEDTARKITDYEKIVAFRNVLIHGYGLIDAALVWRVVQENLPLLHKQVADLLQMNA